VVGGYRYALAPEFLCNFVQLRFLPYVSLFRPAEALINSTMKLCEVKKKNSQMLYWLMRQTYCFSSAALQD
jgi:hypothetical protein